MNSITNKKARFNYHLLDKFEAGIKLLGSEVKSIRSGKVSMDGAWCYLNNNSIWVRGLTIQTYQNSAFGQHETERDRQLLLNKTEIKKLRKATDAGKTIVPTKIYLKQNWIKVEVAVAQGKKDHDKRETIKKRDQERSAGRSF